MKNTENRASYPYDERKTRKITLRRGTMNEKQKKEAFVGVRLMKNAESRVSYPYDRQSMCCKI